MAFHAILCTRDEDDIIGETLAGFLTWADEIHVFDTGSVDRTWDIVNELAGRDSRVRPVERRPVWFSDGMRGYCFAKVRERMREGDWFLRADSDEFYHITPPDFVRDHLQRGETCVYHQYYDFRLTVPEAERLFDLEAVRVERKVPIAERRQSFTVSEYSEPRMCRYRRHMVWPERFTFPANAGFVARKRIPIRHYPNRDPWQLQKRMALRRTMVEAGVNLGRYPTQHHWREEDWHVHLLDAQEPGVATWKPGQDFPLIFNEGHLPGSGKRLAQRLAHGFAVPLLDRWRSGREATFIPEALPDAVQGELSSALRNFGDSEPNL